MKRMLTLLLAAAMTLSLCACGAGSADEREKEKNEVKRDPAAAQYLQGLAVKLAEYPELPAMPSTAELDKAFSTIDYDKMGAEAYEKAQEKIWEDWDARSTKYYDALRALRSEGTAQSAAFLGFTKAASGALLSGENNVVVSPANLYLALAMLSETTDGESRAQLLSLLGLDDTATAQSAEDGVVVCIDDIALHVDQKLRAAPGFLGGNVLHRRGLRPLFGGEGEHARALDLFLAQKVAELFELRLALAGESCDDGGAQHKAGDAFTQVAESLADALFCVAAVHRLQNGVVAVLDGDIEIRHDLLFLRDRVDELIGDVIGIEVV